MACAVQLPLAEPRISFWCLAMEMMAALVDHVQRVRILGVGALGLCVNEKVIEEIGAEGAAISAAPKTGKVTFARLEEGLDGLIHVSEMNLEDASLRPGHVLKEGQRIQVRVLHVDATKQRLGLSLDLEGEFA